MILSRIWFLRELHKRNFFTYAKIVLQQYLPTSLTRFGEILPLWHIFKIVWKSLEIYIVFGKNYPILSSFNVIGQIFIVVSGQKLKK